MNQTLVLLPAFLMVLVTFVVWVFIFKRRIQAMKDNRVHPEKLKSQSAKSLLPEDAHIPAENFTNIFEMPVLFYVWVAFVFMTESLNPTLLVMAFTYAALRAMHSAIHLSYNRVMHRFTVYMISCTVLWIMWLYFGYILISKQGLL